MSGVLRKAGHSAEAKLFDALFSTVGQTPPAPVTGRGRSRTAYELAVEKRALDSIKMKSVRELIQERADAWSTKEHHVLDLDPLRDLVEEESRWEGVASGDYERIDPADSTLFDGVPTEAVLSPAQRPLKGDGRRVAVAQALVKRRQRTEGEVYALPA